MNKVMVLWGLPGSGKSTYAAFAVSQFKNVRVVNCDKNPFVDRDIESAMESHEVVIVDGLCTTNAQAVSLLSMIRDIALRSGRTAHLCVVVWAEDRNACLHNDCGRREISSAITIREASFEEPSTELISRYNLEVIRQSVVRKEAANTPSIPLAKEEERELVSSRWSLGGFSGSCYDDVPTRVVDAEPPVEFTEFEEMLTELCPQITFLQYRKLFRECVQICEEHEHDYYSSGVDYAMYVCNLVKLRAMLKEMGLVQ